MMRYDMDTISHITYQRMLGREPLLRQMQEVRDRYNGDWVLPWISEEEQAEMPQAVPSLVAETIDNMAMRASSVMPDMIFPAIDNSKQTGKRSREYAGIRRGAMVGTHRASKTKLALRRLYRHLAGYATGTLMVVPDYDCEMPKVVVRNPLCSYPEEKDPEDQSPLQNAAFVYAKSASWISAHYPEAAKLVKPSQSMRSEMWDLVEWVDEERCVLGILGPHELADRSQWSIYHGAYPHYMELRSWPNRAGGMVPVAQIDRITLDRVMSQIAVVLGMTDLMARLQTLVIAASEKSVFPDRYIIGDSMKTPRLINESGRWMDGRTGEVNLIQDAKDIGELRGSPDPNLQQTIDRMERNTRVSIGLNPAFGGETFSALRTGRAMDSMLTASVDPRIQEMQELIEPALERINQAIVETYKGTWPDKKYTVFSGWVGGQMIDFVPEQHFETTANAVSYAIPGADIQGITIQLGQLLGMGLISKSTVRALHPYLNDAADEQGRIDEETLEQAALQALIQQAMAGAIPVSYLASVEEQRRKGSPDILTAILKAEEELRAQQAQAAPEPGPGEFAPPEQMPGLSPPGVAPVPQQLPPGEGPAMIEEPPQDQENFQMLLQALGSQPPRGTPPGPLPVPA